MKFWDSKPLAFDLSSSETWPSLNESTLMTTS